MKPDEHLKEKRKKLQSHTDIFFSWLEERQDLVSDIRNLKYQEIETKTKNEKRMYDPQREYDIFFAPAFHQNIQALSLKEVLALSLIIESQAQEFLDDDSYPEWSLAKHVDKGADKISHLINPLLLKSHSIEFFQKLPLKKEFHFLYHLA